MLLERKSTEWSCFQLFSILKDAALCHAYLANHRFCFSVSLKTAKIIFLYYTSSLETSFLCDCVISFIKTFFVYAGKWHGISLPCWYLPSSVEAWFIRLKPTVLCPLRDEWFSSHVVFIGIIIHHCFMYAERDKSRPPFGLFVSSVECGTW